MMTPASVAGTHEANRDRIVGIAAVIVPPAPFVPVPAFPFPVSRFPFPVSRFPFPVSRSARFRGSMPRPG